MKVLCSYLTYLNENVKETKDIQEVFPEEIL